MNVKIDPKITGAFILQLRQEQGLTQKQLAEKLGITDKAISRWETGKGYPDIEMLVSIGEMFSVSVNELLCGERIETPTAIASAEKAVAGAYIDNTVKTHRVSVLASVMGVFVLIGFVIVLLVLTAVVSAGVGSFFTSIKGSSDCVITHDYSSMTLFGEQYVPIMIDNDYLTLGHVLVSEAQVEGAPVWGKLFFGDSIYSIRTIPNNEVVYLVTDYDRIDTNYYCLKSHLEI